MLSKIIKKIPILSTLSEFIGQTPPNLEIPDDSNEILITDQLQTSQINIGANSHITFIAILKKGWSEPQKLHFNFEGENSTLTFLAFILGADQQKFPFETISNHEIPHTNAYYYVRCAMFDRSEVDYTGNLNIRPKAQMTDCYLAHHTLMLSRNAKTRTVPSLEIEADDVKAGHAATVGKVDEDLIFYLESRGLDKSAAQKLLIKSFMETDLQKIPSEEIRLALAEEIEQSMKSSTIKHV